MTLKARKPQPAPSAKCFRLREPKLPQCGPKDYVIEFPDGSAVRVYINPKRVEKLR